MRNTRRPYCSWCKKHVSAMVLNPISVKATPKKYLYPLDYCCVRCEKRLEKSLISYGNNLMTGIEAGT